ncbi:peptide/nickel transport system permease protein [Microbacterium resistens]|uniref:Peptide/nickel transport system permease protein n=1 Tax=Microbacterium resistens TaxID=156977 RepID=A0ABU1SFJ7_9MICO|nr:ABC transporter permease [Microbacterium resistens]MDR6868365.1 peptide/nickel transport system permease protein [Microbacterium resistens]
MIRYVAFRLLQGLFVVWAAFTVCFVILYLLPSDPAEIIANKGVEQGGEPDPAQLAQLRSELGLDRPILVQYISQIGGFLVGSWGRSFANGKPVIDLIAGAFPGTATIALFALIVGTVIGGVIALAAAYTRSARLRSILETLPSLGASLPTFWVALLLMDLFAFRLRILPPLGSEGAATMVLPTLALAVPVAAAVGQVLTRGLLTAMDEPYVDVAVAKGLGRLRLLTVHVLRASALPALTILGVLVGQLLAGAVVVETVFARQGFGRLINEAVSSQDIPLVLGLVVFSAIVFVIVTLVVDVLYVVVDPRLRVQVRRRRSQPIGAGGIS